MSVDDLVITPTGARFQGRRIPCVVGRAGTGVKRGEGDNLSPVGRWRIREFLFRPDRTRLANATPIGLRDAWCDDPQNAAYNTRILLDDPSDEKLRRPDRLYDIVGVLDYNSDPVIPGNGSAIFLHGWRRPCYPTAGCIAFSNENMEWIARNWRDGHVIIQPRWV